MVIGYPITCTHRCTGTTDSDVLARWCLHGLYIRTWGWTGLTQERWESTWGNWKHYAWNRQSYRHVLIASSCRVQAFILCNAGSPSSKNVAKGAKITSDNILHSLAFRIPQLLSMRTSTPLPHASQVLPFAMGRTRLHVLTPHKRQNGRDAVKSERGCNHAALLHFLCTSTSRQRECLLYWAKCVLKILVEKLRTKQQPPKHTAAFSLLSQKVFVMRLKPLKILIIKNKQFLRSATHHSNMIILVLFNCSTLALLTRI